MAGTNATTVTPGIWNMYRMLEAVDELPINVGLFAKVVSVGPKQSANK